MSALQLILWNLLAGGVVKRVASVSMIDPQTPAGIIVALWDEPGPALEVARVEAEQRSLAAVMVAEATTANSIEVLLQSRAVACVPTYDGSGAVRAASFIARGSRLRTTKAPQEIKRQPRESALIAHLLQPLTSRETEVLELAAAGMTNASIAQRLRLNEGTVRVLMGTILRKLHSRNRSEAIRIAGRFAAHKDRPPVEVMHEVFDNAWVMSHMVPVQFTEGSTLVRRGEAANEFIYLRHGEAHLVELGILLKAGDTFGEFGIVGTEHPSSHTIVCATPVEAHRMSAQYSGMFHPLNRHTFTFLAYIVASRLGRGQLGDHPIPTLPH